MEANNYSQVMPMTFEERVAMYMNCDKLDLARMLAERDRMDLELPRFNITYPFDVKKEWWDYQITSSNEAHRSITSRLEV